MDWKEEILAKFDGVEAVEVAEILERWDEPGYCAKAMLRGIVDRKWRKNRRELHQIIDQAPSDGWTVQYAQTFNLPISVAEADLKGVCR
ncbi:MAG: hypothetical protein QXS54_08710 [Candidatus Methanomethylicaceae archaeon]